MTKAEYSSGMVNAYIPNQSTRLTDAERAMIARRDALLGPAYRLFYADPVQIVRGEGVWLFDPQGQRYLDVYNNVASVGHCHPHVVDAITRQVATLNTHTRYLHELILDYADRLLKTLPPALGHLMITCTGSEANDLAYRIAQSATGRTGVIVTSLAYHGITDAVSMFSPSLGQHVPLGAHVRTVPAPSLYRDSSGDLGAAFAADVRAAIASLEASGVGVAAMFCDTIFSSDGVLSDPPGFLADAVRAVQDAGGLFVADEVQPGFARTGEAMWGFLRHGVAPDLVTIGKPMANGMPMAGVVVKPDLVAEFGAKARYFNTFGGNPVCCAAGMAVLEVIEQEHLQQNARQVGEYMRSGVQALAQRHEAIGDVRGAGLFIGVELVRDRATKEPDPELTTFLVNGLRRRHVLIGAAGPHANCLKVRPPLVFTREHADLFLETLDQVFGEYAGQSARR